MTNNLPKYQKIIDQFRGQVLKKDFETKFMEATEHVPKTDRFLLKMELKRLASNCTRLIDLRGHVHGECRSFEYDGKTHFLDDVAIKVFEENIAYYNDYTFGVYESVTNTENNFRVIYQNEKLRVIEPEINAKVVQKGFEKTQYPVKLFSFGPYFNRCEERMNYSIPITVKIDDNKIVETSSSDISVNGCKFRFNSIKKIAVGQIINIRFIGLESEFQFANEEGFNYQVRNVLLVDELQLIGVSRVYLDDKVRDGFKQFLTGFIHTNKRRYKINLENTINALQSRSYEQFVLPKSNELPVFIEKTKIAFVPRYALTGHNNQNTFQYWQDEKQDSTLDFLITDDRIKLLKKTMMQDKSLLVYSFIHKSQGKCFFYTADEVQLRDDKVFMSEFLGFAANRKSFMITSLSIIELDQAKANSPLTLSESVTKQDEYLYQPIPSDVINTLNQLFYMVVASDITTNDLVESYQQLSFDKIETSKLKNFGHKRKKNALIINEIGINYNNHRHESRFKYSTPTIIRRKTDEWIGKSQDFSESGVKVELTNAAEIIKGDVVHLSFPNLQKVTSQFDLKELPYEVMHVNKKKTIINLRVYVEQHHHVGRTFFKLLIDKNREKLTPDEYAMMSPDLAKGLRNIYSSSLTIPSLIVQTSGSRYKIEAMTLGRVKGDLLRYMRESSDRAELYNLYPLLSNSLAISLMTSKLKKMHSSDSPYTDIVYVAINPKIELVEKAVTTMLASELTSPELKNIFIKNALLQGQFFCLQVKISRTSEPDMDYLNPELSYISSYAIHRGKQIEQDIFSVIGVIQLFDITKEALIRYEIASPTHYEIASSAH